jgi:hypothetical protein
MTAIDAKILEVLAAFGAGATIVGLIAIVVLIYSRNSLRERRSYSDSLIKNTNDLSKSLTDNFNTILAAVSDSNKSFVQYLQEKRQEEQIVVNEILTTQRQMQLEMSKNNIVLEKLASNIDMQGKNLVTLRQQLYNNHIELRQLLQSNQARTDKEFAELMLFLAEIKIVSKKDNNERDS